MSRSQMDPVTTTKAAIKQYSQTRQQLVAVCVEIKLKSFSLEELQTTTGNPRTTSRKPPMMNFQPQSQDKEIGAI